MTIQKPFLKWVGGKTQIIENIIPPMIRIIAATVIIAESLLLNLFESL